MPQLRHQCETDVLGDVLGVGGGAEIAVGDPVDQVVMPLQQATERLPVAADRLGRKLAVVGRLQHLPHETQLAGRSLADVTLFLSEAGAAKHGCGRLALRLGRLTCRNALGLGAEDKSLAPLLR